MISEQIDKIKSTLPSSVCLIAVSKTKPISDLSIAYQTGQRHFGENKVQELVEKYEQLPNDIHWHMIGHLQSNKVKYIASFVHLIHTVDSLKLLTEINKQAQKNDRVISCLLQFYIAQEETKFGLNLDEANVLLTSNEFLNLKNIQIAGVMGMASFVDDQDQIRREFQHLNSIFVALKNDYFKTNSDFKEISMGMSGDYELAIEEGSTLIRVGSSIFGGR